VAEDVIMPALGMSQETGVLLQWLKSEGEFVTKGEPLMEIETDKVIVEVEATASGILSHIVAEAGDEIPVGQTVAQISATDEPTSFASDLTNAELESEDSTKLPEAIEQIEVSISPLAQRIAAEHQLDLTQVQPENSCVYKADVLAYLATRSPIVPQPISVNEVKDQTTLASPKARRLARENHLSLNDISGSGPEGAILATDVLNASQHQKEKRISPELTSDTIQRPAISSSWQVMVQRLTNSWTTVPHFFLSKEANAGQLSCWRKQTQQHSGQKITYTDLLVKVVAAALREHPRLNGKWEDEQIILNDEINIGLAVAVENGLVVPVIHQTDQLKLRDLADRRQVLIDQAQNGDLSLEDMQNGTFTISNLGMYGVDAFSAIINPPQAAILALGSITDRVVAIDGQPSVQSMLSLTLSCDHRVVDGARAAQFLQTLVGFIEDPLRLL
tara:strand:+ start:1113 stop:2450 length:1338 start_codon:yes stop_codon:yes gene_type:complete